MELNFKILLNIVKNRCHQKNCSSLIELKMLQKPSLNLPLILSVTLIQSLILFSLKFITQGVWSKPVGVSLGRSGDAPNTEEKEKNSSPGNPATVLPPRSIPPAKNHSATRQRPSKYVPPRTDARRQRLISGGSRGCNQSVNASVTLLVPSSHLPITISSHPIFLFHLDNIPSRPLLFTLVEPGIIKPLFETKLTLTQPGLVTLKLPEQSLGLEIGKEYYWTVSLLCNEKRPSQNAYARAAIKRISPPAYFPQKLISNPDNLEKAEIYAQSGLWYDALASSYQDYLKTATEPPIDAYFWQLLHATNWLEPYSLT